MSLSAFYKHVSVIIVLLLLVFTCVVGVSFASAGIIQINESEDINTEFNAANFSFGYNDYIGLSSTGKRICGYSKPFTLNEDSDVRIFCETLKNSAGTIKTVVLV